MNSLLRLGVASVANGAVNSKMSSLVGGHHLNALVPRAERHNPSILSFGGYRNSTYLQIAVGSVFLFDATSREKAISDLLNAVLSFISPMREETTGNLRQAFATQLGPWGLQSLAFAILHGFLNLLIKGSLQIIGLDVYGLRICVGQSIHGMEET